MKKTINLFVKIITGCFLIIGFIWMASFLNACSHVVEEAEVNQDSIHKIDSAKADSAVKAELLEMDTIHRTLDSTK